MKQKFQISIIRTDGTVLHTGIVAVETPEQLAAQLRHIANTIKVLDFDSLAPTRTGSENRTALGRS